MTLTLLAVFVEADECERYQGGTPPGIATQFKSNFATPKDGRSIRTFTLNGNQVSSNYFDDMDGQPLFIAVYPGKKDQILHIITNIPQQNGEHFVLIHVRAGKDCNVNSMKGGEVTNVVAWL
jgi:hypothetical protein